MYLAKPMKKRIALITGISGQDGAYLAKFLIQKNYTVIGADRRSSRNESWRLRELDIDKKVVIEDVDLLEINNIYRLFNKYSFDEIYNLASQSFVASSFSNPIYTTDVTAISPLRILEVIRSIKKKPKFYQASSSEMFGNSKGKNQNENSSFSPQSPYAIAKLCAHHTVKNYRNGYGIYAVSGILFNHESPLRSEEFLTRKITIGFAKILSKKINFIEVGNIYAKRDWGYAGDYVEAMWKMLQQKKPDDYVIATGKTHSVKDFINLTAKFFDLKTKWIGKGLNEKLINLKNNKVLIKINPKYFRPTEVNYLKGNYSKAKRKLRWYPKTNFKQLVDMMCSSDQIKYG